MIAYFLNIKSPDSKYKEKSRHYLEQVKNFTNWLGGLFFLIQFS